MKVNTIYNYDHKEQKYEENNQPSQTVPDQTMSIREIIDRYANGGVIEQFQPYYGEEEDFTEMLPNTYKMDLAERQSLIEQYSEEIDFMKNHSLVRENESVQTTPEGEQV
jgi:hypothetical protein